MEPSTKHNLKAVDVKKGQHGVTSDVLNNAAASRQPSTDKTLLGQ